MRITKEIFDSYVAERYQKWVCDTSRLITRGDKDEAFEIINDLIEYTYKRIEDKGTIACKCGNIDGYIYAGARLSKTSDSSPYQRKRGLQFIYIPLSEIFVELNETTTDNDDENEL
jgi:hypothetical protein